MKLSPSTSVEVLKNERAINKNQTSFFQNFQLCIFFKDLNRFKFLEYEVQWIRSGGISKSDSSTKTYTLDLNLVGMKEFIGLNQWGDENNVQYHLMPLLNEDFTIKGTQLYINLDVYEKKIFPFPNKEDNQFMCHNRLTKSSY